MASLARFAVKSFLGTTSGLRSSTVSAGKWYYNMSTHQYETLEVTRPSEWVVRVQMNRPQKSNAMNPAFWKEIKDCFEVLSEDVDCRAIMLTGAGKNFSGGLDLMEFAQQFSTLFTSSGDVDVARKAMKIRRMLQPMQDSFTALEKCVKPVIAVVHGACIGGGVDLISACDIRLCTSNAFFQIKEVDIGLMADIGTIQRLPKVIGNKSLLNELIFTARKFSADEALKMGMVSNVFADKNSADSAGLELAKVIASKSPVAVQGSKVNVVYSRDNSVENSLQFALTWNSGMLQTDDVTKAVQASMVKETPTFSKL